MVTGRMPSDGLATRWVRWVRWVRKAVQEIFGHEVGTVDGGSRCAGIGLPVTGGRGVRDSANGRDSRDAAPRLGCDRTRFHMQRAAARHVQSERCPGPPRGPATDHHSPAHRDSPSRVPVSWPPAVACRFPWRRPTKHHRNFVSLVSLLRSPRRRRAWRGGLRGPACERCRRPESPRWQKPVPGPIRRPRRLE